MVAGGIGSGWANTFSRASNGLPDGEPRPGVLPRGRGERPAVHAFTDAPGERFGVVRPDEHHSAAVRLGQAAIVGGDDPAP